MYVSAPSLKEGTGKELRVLHELTQQHVRALKTMGHEPSDTFSHLSHCAKP